MKDSKSKMQLELDQKYADLETAKQVRKHSKAALKAEMKAIKAQLKPFKLAYKQAKMVEEDAKKAYKTALKQSKKSGNKVEKSPKGTTSELKKREKFPKKVSPQMEIKPSQGKDDLTKIKGIGEIVANMLYENGIITFQDMAKTSYNKFKELLRANNMSKYRNPTNWAKEAAVLAKSGGAPSEGSSKTTSSSRPKRGSKAISK